VGVSGLAWIAAAASTGIVLALQGPVNAKMGAALAAPIAAALVSSTVTATIALGMLMLSGQGVDWRAPPLWLYGAGGALGICIITAAIIITPKLGASTFLAAAIFGQLAAGLILDHFGLIGMPQHAISFGRIAGVALVLAGAVLIRAF
jgi:transporter family-2 protein